MRTGAGVRNELQQLHLCAAESLSRDMNARCCSSTNDCVWHQLVYFAVTSYDSLIYPLTGIIPFFSFCVVFDLRCNFLNVYHSSYLRWHISIRLRLLRLNRRGSLFNFTLNGIISLTVRFSSFAGNTTTIGEYNKRRRRVNSFAGQEAPRSVFFQVT